MKSTLTCCFIATRRRGTTLIEVVVSLILVSVMLVAAMRTVGTVFHTRLFAQQHQEGETLAHDLMAEILAMAYEDPDLPGNVGLESGETGDGSRALWDDVDDYDQWDTLPAETRDGIPLANADGWKRKVTVESVDRSSPETTSATDTGLKRITVEVISPAGETYELYALRSRWGALEAKPPIDMTYVTGITARLRVGRQPEAVQSGTAILNHAEGP